MVTIDLNVLLLKVHSDNVNNFFWKLIDSSKQISAADSSPEIPSTIHSVIVGIGSRAKAQVRNVVFCSNCPICEFAFWHAHGWSEAWYEDYSTAYTL